MSLKYAFGNIVRKEIVVVSDIFFLFTNWTQSFIDGLSFCFVRFL